MATDSVLRDLESKVLWLSTWMIHNANHLRESVDGLKVGGHQASSASMVSILTALYFEALRPQDRVAVKPHASPAFHAIQYLFGRISLRKLQDFRAFGGAQSYPSRTKDVDDVDFSTGSVGLGVAQTLFAAFAQDYAQAKGFGSEGEAGRMIALSGDAEMDEGNIFEALLEGWKHDVRNVWWVIDYNRQSLDAVVREGLWSRFEAIFRDFGWDVVILKHGRLQQAAFQEPGGEALRVWIDCCPNQLYCALTYQGGAAWRARLAAAFKDDPQAADLVARRTDVELASLMANLGGHDIPGLIAAFAEARKTDRPTCFIAYTIKGWGLPLAGHKDNHAGLLTPTQVEALRQSLGVRAGHEWDAFEPAFVDELAVIMKFAFEYMQRSPGKGEGQGEWDSSGGAVYLRLTTRSIEQPTRSMDEALARDIVKGGYWMRPPGPGTELVIIAMGAVVPEAIRAIGLLAEDRRDAALLVVTSADRLHGEWTAAERARDDGRQVSPTHIEKLLEPLSARAGLVSVLDGHPATLGWVGSVRGHRMRTLGVDSFGQSGSLADLYQHHAIDARAIMRAAQTLCPGRPLRLMSFA